jgi:hypothetical protein
MEIKEEENKKIIEQENAKINKEPINESIELILKEIFINKNVNNKTVYEPILLISDNIKQKLNLIFNNPEPEIKSNISSLQTFINNKIELFKKIKDIIGNSYEILHIIINYLLKNKINPIQNIIDLYFDFILINSNISNSNETLINIKEIIIWFFSCGFMNKKYSDYIYQKIARLQFEKKLTPELFEICLNLIEVIYGKNFDDSYKKNLLAKNYIYFYNKENSILRTNISKYNNIKIENGCSVVMWLYIKNDMAIGSKLFHITINKNIENNKDIIATTFDFILNDNYDIDIKTKIKGSDIILKEEKNKKFKIEINKWIQLKLQMMKSEIRINLYLNPV